MAIEQEKLTITPDTRIGPLLDRFPHLEAPLMKLSTAYAKLKNPLLRKTIAKVATLQQVAKIGEVPLGDLINTLRCELGIEEQWRGSDKSTAGSGRPGWLQQDRIAISLDAIPMLEAGEHPLGRVMSELQQLKAGQVYELITPFVPAPLLDAVTKKGFQVYSEKPPDGTVRSYFCLNQFQV